MRQPSTRTLQDRVDGALRQIKALGRFPAEWEPNDLRQLLRLETVIGEVRKSVVYGMRENGVTDRQIADALGITQQAVSKRWPGGGRYVGAAGRYRKPKGDT